METLLKLAVVGCGGYLLHRAGRKYCPETTAKVERFGAIAGVACAAAVTATVMAPVAIFAATVAATKKANTIMEAIDQAATEGTGLSIKMTLTQTNMPAAPSAA